MRIVLIIFCLLLSSTLKAQSCDEISVSGSDQWIPFAYAEGERASTIPKGIAYDVVRLIGRDLGIPVNIQVGIPWARIEAMLENGDLDLLAGNYWNKERAKKWIVTDAFAEDDVRIFVKKDQVFPFHDLNDLIGKRGLMPQGISFGQKFDAFKANLNLATVQLHNQMITMLHLNRADYVILPFYSGLNKIKSFGHKGKIVPLDTPVNVNTVHLSLSRLSPCAELINQINRIIALRKADGSFEAVFASYRE